MFGSDLNLEYHLGLTGLSPLSVPFCSVEMLIIVYLSSSSSEGSEVFVTLRPVVTEPTDCVLLE